MIYFSFQSLGLLLAVVLLYWIKFKCNIGVSLLTFHYSCNPPLCVPAGDLSLQSSIRASCSSDKKELNMDNLNILLAQ